MMAKLYGVPAISPAELEQQLGNPNLFIVDANPRRVWAKGHVPGAVNLDPADYTERDLPADKGTTLVFYCSVPLCGAAPHAARRARRMGYTNVFVMSAGIQGWIEQHRPIEQGT